jgi:Zn finger protein HypA/HybF involved in hydrogenase expression
MRYRSILFALLLVPSAACESLHDDMRTTPTVRIGESVVLAVGQTAVVQDADVEITFESVVSDTRCPTDMICIVAGDATIRLRAVRRGMSAARADVQLLSPPTAFAYGGVEFVFEGLDPWPTSQSGTIPRDRYRATIGTRAQSPG